MGSDLPIVDLLKYGQSPLVGEVAAGSVHTCARMQDPSAGVMCWGGNSHDDGVTDVMVSGQLGLGDSSNRGDESGEMGQNLPAVDFGTGRSAVMLALGGGHSCALLDDETVKCWGRNDAGQLGLGDTSNRGVWGGQMGDRLPAVPLCLAPCPAGYTGPYGGPCAACEEGTYKATAGSGTCTACPAKATSAVGSDELANCFCTAWFAGPDGGTCVACSDCESVLSFEVERSLWRRSEYEMS